MSHQSYTVDAAECAQRQRNRWAFDGTTSLTTNDGRLFGQQTRCSQTCQSFNDLPRLWFVGVSQEVS